MVGQTRESLSFAQGVGIGVEGDFLLSRVAVAVRRVEDGRSDANGADSLGEREKEIINQLGN